MSSSGIEKKPNLRSRISSALRKTSLTFTAFTTASHIHKEQKEHKKQKPHIDAPTRPTLNTSISCRVGTSNSSPLSASPSLQRARPFNDDEDSFSREENEIMASAFRKALRKPDFRSPTSDNEERYSPALRSRSHSRSQTQLMKTAASSSKVSLLSDTSLRRARSFDDDEGPFSKEEGKMMAMAFRKALRKPDFQSREESSQVLVSRSHSRSHSIGALSLSSPVARTPSRDTVTSIEEMLGRSRGVVSRKEESNRDLEEILRIVEGVLEDEKQSKQLMESKGEDAQLWLDALHVLAKLPGIATGLRSSILKAMVHLSKRSGLFPQCLIISNVRKLGEYPVGGGGFGDVWEGKIGEQTVCLKVVKPYLTSDVRQLLKEYMREAIVWEQLQHPNLLPFMGMYYFNEARSQLCLVSPWMERGNLDRFLKTTAREHVDHYSLVYDVASGLAYLHSRKIVHGDLKGVNILITPDERACIADFGLSRVADSHAIKLSSSTATHSKGTTRWLSPELLRPDPPSATSLFSDMYAFACVCYEIFTGSVPFHDLNDAAVIVAVLLYSKQPSRPELALLSDGMWGLMVDCWNTDPRLRPTASDVLARVAGFKSLKTGSIIKPAPDWDDHHFAQIWKEVKYPLFDVTALVRLQKGLGSPAIR